MRSHRRSRDAKRLTVVLAPSPETGLLHLPACSACRLEPWAGSSRCRRGCHRSGCLRQVLGKEERSRHVSLTRATTRAHPRPALGNCRE